jgi:hypothetical protein
VYIGTVTPSAGVTVERTRRGRDALATAGWAVVGGWDRDAEGQCISAKGCVLIFDLWRFVLVGESGWAAFILF